nr:hypothetical protein CFP56_00416 [Quercus suber]
MLFAYELAQNRAEHFLSGRGVDDKVSVGKYSYLSAQEWNTTRRPTPCNGSGASEVAFEVNVKNRPERRYRGEVEKKWWSGMIEVVWSSNVWRSTSVVMIICMSNVRAASTNRSEPQLQGITRQKLSSGQAAQAPDLVFPTNRNNHKIPYLSRMALLLCFAIST